MAGKIQNINNREHTATALDVLSESHLKFCYNKVDVSIKTWPSSVYYQYSIICMSSIIYKKKEIKRWETNTDWMKYS